ncbi:MULTISPECIES: photosystem II reaction center protein Ycf12/Psb30 [Aerosakkonema]
MADFPVQSFTCWVSLGGKMDFLSGILSPITSLNWEVIAQLVLLALIVLAGPAVIVVLATRGGDL